MITKFEVEQLVGDKINSIIISEITDMINELITEQNNFGQLFVVRQKFNIGQRKVELMKKHNLLKFEVVITNILIKKGV